MVKDSGQMATGARKEYGSSHEMLNAVLWQQAAPEYVAISRQTFQAARSSLDAALRDTRWTAALEQARPFGDLPPAIMLDLDETVLDNTPYEARIVREYGSYSWQTFAGWCTEAAAQAVPGVREFLEYAKSRGVEIFYYSSRRNSLRECTLKNLHAIGLPVSNNTDSLLLNEASKSRHRANIAAAYRILLLVGDNLEDFVEDSKTSPASRRELADRYRDRWGRQWILLPNPMYGHWEASFYGYDYRLPRQEQLQRKASALRER